ncbi:MAG: COX15/CtaA family protein [Acidobacteriota bacterium]|nr:COX15/CtaA family protein [Acidobacteriota bacterium]
MPAETPRALHAFAVLLVGAVLGLIAAGGLVKSLEAGLSVPDWPTSYGGWNPPRWWEIENVRAEHGHRLIAGTVASLTVAMALWAWRREPRRWVRRVAYGAVAAVLLQALLGGITVLFFLPTAVSVSHAALAQLYLCLVVAFALATSRGWRSLAAGGGRGAAAEALRGPATATTALIYAQILLGALVRHTGSGLAIPDFPLMFGRWWPPQLDFSIAIHLAHRLGALAVTLAVGLLVARVWSRGERSGLLGPALVMALLVAVQVSLGASIIWTGRAVLPNTLHVPTGAALLAASLVLTLRAWHAAVRVRAVPAAVSAVAA